jgi:acetoin utilization protein AcuC
MEAGLAPGMVRRGLRLIGEFTKCLDTFVCSLGLKSITTNALFYHNAISWEKYGFTYFRGERMMENIQKEFQPGGLLYEKLDASTPFRKKGMEKSVRGRSWAIYDGVYSDAFGEEWESPIMYKIQGKDFKVNTFPSQIY